MTRNAVFDPTDRALFGEQQQRFDWSLLQLGNVVRYETAFQLTSACARLTDLGYITHEIDAATWTTVEDMHTTFAQTMSFPAYYGRNLDAFNDVLRDVATFDYGSDPVSTGTVLAIAHYDTLVDLDRYTAEKVLHIFAVQARMAGLYGHPMLCLVHTQATDLGRVGGVVVHEGSVWDTEPDPPRPFGATDRLEFVVQFFSTSAELGDALDTLRNVLAEPLSAVGRWMMLDPEPATGAVSSPPENLLEELTDGGRRGLMQVSIGVRGEGDYSALDEKIYARAQSSGIVFVGTSSRIYPADSHEGRHFASKYPGLGNTGDAAESSTAGED
ncbi:barstar family protein [Rhodococcus gordoniae]|uniref:barstar family protein n=1 Tax=Rhodococcus gordoniae TaxID=223392 RepID=UPI0020CF601B|nr:barstar family protein [Rhodococcus gordoniae]UTT51201.1 barstar family protein [Rhodococcus gordoniae]